MNKAQKLSLQLFAEGGDGSGNGVSGPAAEGNDGSIGNPANAVVGVQSDTGKGEPGQTATAQEEGASPAETFASLIGKGGKYETDFKNEMQRIVQHRLKGSKEMAQKLEKASPIMEALAQRYGKTADDYEGILAAFDDDNALLEAEAEATGKPIETLKSERKMQRELELLRLNERNREAERIYNGWLQQADAAKKTYPGLDLNAELESPQFISLLKSGVDVKTAYVAMHHDEILTAGMSYATEHAKEAVSKSVAAGAMRPIEGVNGKSSAAIATKINVSDLNKRDFNDICRRVASGERITLG